MTYSLIWNTSCLNLEAIATSSSAGSWFRKYSMGISSVCNSFPIQLVAHQMPHANPPSKHPELSYWESLPGLHLENTYTLSLPNRLGRNLCSRRWQWHCCLLQHYWLALIVFKIALYFQGLVVTYIISPPGTFSLGMMSFSVSLGICVRNNKLDMQQSLKIKPKLC